MSLFSFESVSLSFDDREVLEEFSLEVEEGEKVILKGASGSGKSTLLKLLLGFVQPNQGEVRFWGESISPTVARDVRQSAAYVSQELSWEPGDVMRKIDEFFAITAVGKCPEPDEIKATFERLRLQPELLDQKVQDLSGGERHRVGLAIGLMLQRPVFLLDEPTAALDESLKREVADLFLGSDSWTVIAAAHDPTWFKGRDVTLIDLDS